MLRPRPVRGSIPVIVVSLICFHQPVGIGIKVDGALRMRTQSGGWAVATYWRFEHRPNCLALVDAGNAAEQFAAIEKRRNGQSNGRLRNVFKVRKAAVDNLLLATH